MITGRTAAIAKVFGSRGYHKYADPAGIQSPAVSVSNMLGRSCPGIIAVTRSGEPGNSFSEFWILGISTFGASQSALVLIDRIGRKY